ncbi:MAG TPA: class A beta-lactamase-related serine hydrolase [Deltaproteobacteria bacterium]|nr:class A beta-lactamase-related serine hydrolase [Deltaproteobacteria bacterium]
MIKILPKRLILACAASVFLFSGSTHAFESLENFLTPYLASHELPALAAAVVKEGQVIAAGAVGTRRAGQNIPVNLLDRFHLGSNTKAMTALLIAARVDRGDIDWNSTLSQIFPEMASGMHPSVRSITVGQLLSHTSGIEADNEDFLRLLEKSMSQSGNLDELRYWLVRQWLMLPVESKPGSKFAYANMNYVILGAIVERLEDKTWEEVIVEKIFTPLELNTAGLGPQSSPGRINAPLGHLPANGRIKAMLAGPSADNPLIIGPAGSAHMSILDFAKWAGWNAGQGKREPQLVTPRTLKKLHKPVVVMAPRKDAPPGTPSGGRYAFGWGEFSVKWANHPLIYHGGSNGMNLAHIWLDTQRDFAMVMATNIGSSRADAALLEIAGKLYEQYTKKKTKSK